MVRRLILMLPLAIALGSPAVAEGPGMFHGGGGPDGPGSLMQGEDPMRILRGIKLTPEQETQVHKILEENHAGLHDLFDQLRGAQDALATTLLQPGKISAADVKPQLDRTLQIRQQLAERGLEVMLAVRAVLTPDQLAKAADRRARIKALEAQMRKLLEESN